MESRKNEMDDRVFSASIVISCIINKPINGKKNKDWYFHNKSIYPE